MRDVISLFRTVGERMSFAVITVINLQPDCTHLKNDPSTTLDITLHAG